MPKLLQKSTLFDFGVKKAASPPASVAGSTASTTRTTKTPTWIMSDAFASSSDEDDDAKAKPPPKRPKPPAPPPRSIRRAAVPGSDSEEEDEEVVAPMAQDWVFYNNVAPIVIPPQRRKKVTKRPAEAPASPSRNGKRPAQATERAEGEAAATPAPSRPVPILPSAIVEEDADESEILDQYTSPVSALGPVHPSTLCYSATLEYAKASPIGEDEARQLLGAKLIATQALSCAQVHAVAMAQRAFGNGRAFLLGDGTGVGKGRQSLGVVAAHWFHSGSRRALVVTASSNLATDVKRDFDALRMGKLFPGTVFVDAGAALPKTLPKKCVVFTTYSQIRSKKPAAYVALLGERKRPPELRSKAEVAKDDPNKPKPPKQVYHGTIVLDEVHKGAGNPKSDTYASIKELLALSPDSPLLALSATFAANLEGLRLLAPRLGLVGPDRSFLYFQDLKNALGRHAETGLELVAGSLAKEGCFLARSISFHGTEVGHVDCFMSDAHHDLYKESAAIFKELFQTGLFGGKDYGVFCGEEVRFFKSLLLLAKLDDVISATYVELEAGRQVVLSVLSTEEAALNRASADDIEEQGGVSALGDVFDRLLTKAEELDDPENKPAGFVAKKHAALLKTLRSRVRLLDLPCCSALDLLNDTFADVGVAELTGRTSQLRRNRATGNWEAKSLPRNLTQSRADFQAGKFKVAIVSGAASTGISLHDTGDKHGTSRPRTMILYELPWSATATQQLLGRVHRAGQLSLPKFMTASVCSTEQRFSGAVAHRLKQLGALTSGDKRDTGSNAHMQLDGEEVLSAAGKRAAARFADELGRGAKDGRQFMNRALALPPSKSEPLLARYFEAIHAELKLDVSRGRTPAPRATLTEDGHHTQVTADVTQGPNRLLTLKLNRNVSYAQICAKRDQIVAAGGSRTEFATSIAHGFVGLGLAHHRDGIGAVRFHFVDGRVASIVPDKVLRYEGNDVEKAWTAVYNHQATEMLYLAAIPCFEALGRLTTPPRVYRITLKSGEAFLAISLNKYLHGDLGTPPKPKPKVPEAKVPEV